MNDAQIAVLASQHRYSCRSGRHAAVVSAASTALTTAYRLAKRTSKGRRLQKFWSGGIKLRAGTAAQDERVRHKASYATRSEDRFSSTCSWLFIPTAVATTA